jgi:hypothetical protein
MTCSLPDSRNLTYISVGNMVGYMNAGGIFESKQTRGETHDDLTASIHNDFVRLAERLNRLAELYDDTVERSPIRTAAAPAD